MNRHPGDRSEAARISKDYGISLDEAEALLREHDDETTPLGAFIENAVRFLKAPS